MKFLRSHKQLLQSQYTKKTASLPTRLHQQQVEIKYKPQQSTTRNR